MKCPVCDNVRMREVVKEGVTIDVCPDCKGVWLDRGELDKLMQGVREAHSEVNGYGAGSPAPGSYLDQLRNNGGAQSQGGHSTPNAAQQTQSYGSSQHGSYGYGSPQSGSYDSRQPASGNYGSQQQPPYGTYGSQQHQSGYGNGHSGHRGHASYGSYGQQKYGYGYPYKKKSVLDLLGDLFD
ncbi:hypothetical protein PCURB6_41310 [Paenibacillus curdlanolyticus]|nr:hypothetical protein PCURB6_41310 [Paenibacillus curdlanolyticus]